MRSRTPKIKSIKPEAGIEGGKILIEGSGFDPEDLSEFRVAFGDTLATPMLISSTRVLVQIPDEVQSGAVTIRAKGKASNSYKFAIGQKLSASVNPVDNPVFDWEGNLLVTFSGKRGEEVPVSVYRISPSGDVKPYLTNIPNPTSMAMSADGDLFVSSRFEGTIYRANKSADVSVFAKDLGVPTGLAFDDEGNLFVGDRGGKIYRVSPKGEATVFAELPESTVAFHLAFDKDGNLLVTNPGLSSYNHIWMIDRYGKATSLYGGFGRPQGMAVDNHANIFVCEAKAGDSGILKIAPDGTITPLIATPVVVGLAFDEQGNLAVAAPHAVYKVPLTHNGN